ncbi:rod shape-determining protein MreD [Stomatohabitans albus]|uniref:rod shape-determining protein MreD n=1 Tax=Stomatohabitans albus TaxID=3110766 RepID=UPI00300CEF03
MGRYIVMGVTIALALILKTSIFPHLAIGGVRPDLVALVIVAFALSEGPDTGMRLGFVAGLVQDLLGGPATVVGTGALFGLIIGWAAGASRPFIAANVEFGSLAVALLGAMGLTGGQVLIAGLLGANNISLGALLLLTLGTGLYSVVLSPLVLWAAKTALSPFPKATIGQL